MKKFEFTLESLKNYREQVLDGEKATLAAMRADLRTLEAELEDILKKLAASGEKLNEMYFGGTYPNEIAIQKRHISALQAEVHQHRHKILMKQREIEAQLNNVVSATQEVSKLENLEEHQLEDYKMAVQKEEELFIDEFVTNSDWRKANVK